VKRLIHMGIAAVTSAIVLTATGAPASAHTSYEWSPNRAGTGAVADSPSAGPHRAAGANWTDCYSLGFVRTHYWYPTGYAGYVTDNTCANGYTWTPILSQRVTHYQVCEYWRDNGDLIECNPRRAA
jgi:hypothetical protein